MFNMGRITTEKGLTLAASHSFRSDKPPPTDPVSVKRTALKHMAQKEYAAALSMMQELLKEDPKNVHAVDLLIEIHGKCKRVDLAETMFNYARDHHIVDTPMCFEMLLVYKHNNRPEGTINVYEYAARNGLATTKLCTSVINIILKSKRTKAARAVFDDAFDRGLVDAHLARIMMFAYVHIGNFDESLRIFQQTKHLKDPKKTLYTTILYFCRKAKRMDIGEKIFKNAKKKNIVTVDMCATMEKSYRIKKNPEGATNVWKYALEKKIANSTLCTSVMNTNVRFGRYATVRDVFEDAVDNEIANKYHFTMMIQLYDRADNPHEAMEIVDKAKNLTDRDEQFYLAAMWVCSRTGKVDRAREFFNQALDEGCADEFTFQTMIDIYKYHEDNAGEEEIRKLASETTYINESLIH
jgi:predicted Zn-dependent protease